MRLNPKYIPLLATAAVLIAVFGTGSLLYPNFGTPRVIVNLEQVRYIDSAGVASLVEGLKLSRDLKSTFALYGLSRTAREVLELTRLIKVFEVYDNEEEALRGGSTNVAPAR